MWTLNQQQNICQTILQKMWNILHWKTYLLHPLEVIEILQERGNSSVERLLFSPFAIDNFPRRLRPVVRIYQEHTPKNAQIWSFESRANILICCQQTSDFMAKMRWIQFQLELSPRPHWGSLVLPQTLLLDLRGPTSKGGKGK